MTQSMRRDGPSLFHSIACILDILLAALLCGEPLPFDAINDASYLLRRKTAPRSACQMAPRALLLGCRGFRSVSREK